MPQAGRDGSQQGHTVVNENETVDIYLGLDVGKGEHHATALTPAGKKAFDKPLPNTEPKLRELLSKLQSKYGTVLVVVDQPASIGALPLVVARNMGCQVAYLPGLTMRRIAELYPGEAKTDAKDAYVIADAARTIPHTLRAINPADETTAELQMVIGFDDDLTAESTPHQEPSARPTHPDPPLTRTGPGPTPGPSRRPGPTGALRLTRTDPQGRASPPDRAAAAEGAAHGRAFGGRHLYRSRRAGRHRSRDRSRGTDRPQPHRLALRRPRSAQGLATRIEDLLEAHPLSQVLTSMPGIGIKTTARILIDVGDGTAFPTAGHLASYAGLAPATRASGSSIRGEQPRPAR